MNPMTAKDGEKDYCENCPNKHSKYGDRCIFYLGHDGECQFGYSILLRDRAVKGERERDALRATVERLTRERDEARAQSEERAEAIKHHVAERRDASNRAEKAEADAKQAHEQNDRLVTEHYALKASCAQMRVALERVSEHFDWETDVQAHDPTAGVMYEVPQLVFAALATDAGRELLEKLERYEKALATVVDDLEDGENDRALVIARAALRTDTEGG